MNLSGYLKFDEIVLVQLKNSRVKIKMFGWDGRGAPVRKMLTSDSLVCASPGYMSGIVSFFGTSCSWEASFIPLEVKISRLEIFTLFFLDLLSPKLNMKLTSPDINYQQTMDAIELFYHLGTDFLNIYVTNIY